MTRAPGHARRLALLPLAALAGCIGRAPPPAAPDPGPAAVPAPPRPSPTFMLDGAIRQGGTVRGTAPEGTIGLTLDGAALPMAADRGFVFGLDRDAAATASLVAALADGRRVERRLAVAPGGWRIEPVDAPLTAGRTSAEFERLRPAELAEIAAARAIDHASDGWRQRFVWPVTGRRSGLFGAQRVYRGVPGSFHSGADVAVPAGTPVRAPADGVVALATTRAFTLEGRLVILDHGMGLNSAFLHLSAIDVRPGQRVRQGDILGRVGATGRATGPHMHWGMKWRAARVDPALVAGEMEQAIHVRSAKVLQTHYTHRQTRPSALIGLNRFPISPSPLSLGSAGCQRTSFRHRQRGLSHDFDLSSALADVDALHRYGARRNRCQRSGNG